MFDFTPINGWVNPGTVRSAASTLQKAGTHFADEMSDAAKAYAPISEHYRKGPGRDDMVEAMIPPQIHARGLSVMTSMVQEALDDFAGRIEDLEGPRENALETARYLEGAVRDAKADGTYADMHDEWEWRIQMCQGDINMLGSDYEYQVKKCASAIRDVTATSPEFRQVVMDNNTLDTITGPLGAETTPGISAMLKLLRRNKDGDKFGKSIKFLAGLGKNKWMKWSVKFTTPISWSLNYFDQADDSYIANIIEHPEWSHAQVSERMWTEVAVKGTTRSVVGTAISEVASARAGARAGAIAGSRGGFVGVAVGAATGFVYGTAANAASRYLGVGSGASGMTQGAYDRMTGGGQPTSAPEWAPDPYPTPQKAAPTQLPTPPAPTPKNPTPPPTNRPGLPTPSGPEPKPNPYVVKEGDYLEKIAKDYGTSWPKVYEANRDKIQDPDLIYPGQKLTIPTTP